MSSKNTVIAVVFPLFLFVLLYILCPIGISVAEDDVKDPNPPVDTGPAVSTDSTGGPDGFGYSFTDSTELDGPAYNFIDISGTGTPQGLTGDDAGTAPINIGFPFNFYGTTFNQLAMSTNGYINFNTGGDISDFSNNCPGLSADDPDNSIYVYWDDLIIETDSDVYVQTFANCPNTSGGAGACTVFMWDEARHFGGAAFFDFEAILYDNGNILSQFAPGNPEMGLSSTTGIENQFPSTIGLDYACDTSSSITDNLAVCFIHPDSPKQDCNATLELADVNNGVCVFTKSVPNEIQITGATPNKKVALIMGKKPGSFIIGGNVCNGTQLDLSQPRIVGIYTADSNGAVSVQSPVPPSGNLGKAYFQVVDVASCTTNEAKQYYLVPDELPDADFDGDGIVNCDDACPLEGLPNPMMEGRIGPDGCLVNPCDAETEVFYDGDCYYLDGSAGNCLLGYVLAPQSVLEFIAADFIGKTYKTTQSDNCCIWHADQGAEGQDWGMTDGVGSNDCNNPGPFGDGPLLDGAGCTDAMNMLANQLTLCVSQGIILE